MRAIALFTPEAMPASLGPASASTVEVSGATIIERPNGEDERSAAGAPSSSRSPGESSRIQRQATAQISGPMPMNQRGPSRIESRPKRPERKNITTVIGSVANPLRSGE